MDTAYIAYKLVFQLTAECIFGNMADFLSTSKQALPLCASNTFALLAVYSYLRQGGNVFAGFCLFVCESAR